MVNATLWLPPVTVANVDRSEASETPLPSVSRQIAAITETPIQLGNGEDVRMTISVGACLVQANETIDTAVAKTDAALYAAKRAGRDRVVIFDPALHGSPKIVKLA